MLFLPRRQLFQEVVVVLLGSVGWPYLMSRRRGTLHIVWGYVEINASESPQMECCCGNFCGAPIEEIFVSLLGLFHNPSCE